MTVAAVASDPLIAINRIRIAAPDVITLDIEMPRMSGLEFLEKLMRFKPLPVVMVSSLTDRGADATMRALELGAVDFIAKPQSLTGDLESYATEVAEKLRAAAGSRVKPLANQLKAVRAPGSRGTSGAGTAYQVIVVGASTGGVEALRDLLEPLPPDMPPILIAQHMPAGFTNSFAKRLDSVCALDVREGRDGELLRSGQAYIAPGGRHMTLARDAHGLAIRLSDDPPVNRHRPSVDPLFRSAARLAGKRCIGVILTGMGADGAEAMLELRTSGARNIAQDEASCVVFGMPMQAIKAGAVHDVLPLGAIPRRLVELCAGEGGDSPE
jgi:two-component system chemotaxis response regulator CheB